MFVHSPESRHGNQSTTQKNNVKETGGRPLRRNLRSHFESRFGHDFSRAWIRDEVGSTAAARLLEASADTIGRDISIAKGQYQPFGLTSIPVMPPGIQRKSTVNSPGDAYEREADQAADQVLRMAVPPPLHAERPSSSVVEAAADAGNALPGTEHGGEPLPKAVRSYFEPRFGHDFSQVRVHADRAAAHAAQGLQARAYTIGRNIVFGLGEYTPTSANGRQLLAHELAHVVQQGAARPSRSGAMPARAQATNVPAVQRQVVVSSDADRAEAERMIKAFLEADAPKTSFGDVDVEKIAPQLMNLGNFGPALPGPRRDQRNDVREAIRLVLERGPRKPGPLAKAITDVLPMPFPRKPLSELHRLPVVEKKRLTEQITQTLRKGTDKNQPTMGPSDAPTSAGRRDPGEEASKNIQTQTLPGAPIDKVIDSIRGDKKPRLNSVVDEVPKEGDAKPENASNETLKPASQGSPSVPPTADSAAPPVPSAEPAGNQPGLGVLPRFALAALRQAQADGRTTADLHLAASLRSQQETVFGQVRFLLRTNSSSEVVSVNVYFGRVLAKTVRMEATK